VRKSKTPEEQLARQIEIARAAGLEVPDDVSTAPTGLKKALLDAKQKLKEDEEADKKKNADILAMLPKPFLVILDQFLKGGLAITTVAFVAAGLAICLEAATVAFSLTIPPELDDFIVKTVEPNFTPLLGVLLLFSISLGVFTTIQLGSDEATYKE